MTQSPRREDESHAVDPPAETALRESERRLATLLSNLAGMAYRCRNDGDWTMEFVSEGCFALTGRHHSEIIASRAVSWNSLIHPDDRQAVWEGVQRGVAERRQYQLVYRITTADGRTKWVWEQGVGVFDDDGQLEALEGFITDVTEPKQAEAVLQRAYDDLEREVARRTADLAAANDLLRREMAERARMAEALRLSETRYRGLVEASPDAVVMSDLEGRVLVASQQTWTLLELDERDELRGRSVLEYVIEADRRRLAANLMDVIKVGLRQNTEYTALTKTGHEVPVDVSSVVIRDAEGNPQGAMAVIRDIRRRKEVERALRKSYEDLQSLYAGLARERQTLRHMLRASDHERQLIAYEIHDGVAQRLAAAIMQFQAHEHLRRTQPEEAETARAAGLQMLRQANLETRRLISGVRPPILDESGIAAAVAHLVHDERSNTGLAIEFVSRVAFDRLPRVLENAIYRIAQEALTNACRHSRAQRICVSFVQEESSVRLEVQDWGQGFDPANVEGDHFGLEGIRERARLLGGQAAIVSRPGEGTTVSAILPLVEPDDVALDAAAPRPGSPSKIV
jgi:PAS domain S-box-containing protein